MCKLLFIYEKVASYYSNVGRKSIDPVILIKMLLIGYLYGINSERRLEEEVSLNLAYRRFCDMDLMQRVPNHSTFCQNRRRRFKDSTIFREISNEIVLQCIQLGIISTTRCVRYKENWKVVNKVLTQTIFFQKLTISQITSIMFLLHL